MKPAPIEIPKPVVHNPIEIIDRILPVAYQGDKVINMNPEFMNTIGHPLESTGRTMLRTP